MAGPVESQSDWMIVRATGRDLLLYKYLDDHMATALSVIYSWTLPVVCVCVCVCGCASCQPGMACFAGIRDPVLGGGGRPSEFPESYWGIGATRVFGVDKGQADHIENRHWAP